MRLIRVMCSGRVDMSFVLRAFSQGADGVFIGACHLGECNYITHGNFQALIMVNILRKLMKHLGLHPERVCIRFMSGSEANVYVDSVNTFNRQIEELGPIGLSEGLDKRSLALRLDAATKMVPFMKQVERERLKVPLGTEEEINAFFLSDKVEKLFDEIIPDELAIRQIMQLLRQESLSTGEISEALGMSPSETSRLLDGRSMSGLVRRDQELDRYSLACAVDSEESIAFYIDPEACQACGTCFRKCPSGAILGGKKSIHVIDQEKCTRCGTCFVVCPTRFSAVRRVFSASVPLSISEEARNITREPVAKVDFG